MGFAAKIATLLNSDEVANLLSTITIIFHVNFPVSFILDCNKRFIVHNFFDFFQYNTFEEFQLRLAKHKK